MKTRTFIAAGLAVHARTTRAVPSVFALAALLIVTAASAGAQTYVNFEGKQTRPICLSPDGTRLFAVNTPDARLSVFDVTHPLSRGTGVRDRPRNQHVEHGVGQMVAAVWLQVTQNNIASR